MIRGSRSDVKLDSACVRTSIMGILKQSVILVIILAIAIRLSKVFGPSLPVVVDGFCRPDFKEVENVFRYV